MKLTKSQLKCIIKEELTKVIEGNDEARAIEAFSNYVREKGLPGRGIASNLVSFVSFNPDYLGSLPAIAAHHRLSKEDILGFARSRMASGVLTAILTDALADYEGPT